MAKKRTASEWAINRVDEYAAELSYRCMVFSIESDGSSELTDSELILLDEMVATLNKHFKEPKALSQPYLGSK